VDIFISLFEKRFTMPTTTRRSLLRTFTGASLVAMTSIAGRTAFAASVKPDANSALIVVDVQNCFVTGGTLPVKGGEEVVPVINKLSAAFENIVITQDWHTKGHASFASTHASKKPFDTIQLAYGKQVLWPDHCVRGTSDAALHKDLQLPRAQVVVRKGYHQGIDSYSAFTEADGKTPTGLDGYLKQRVITRVYVTGLATDFCVAWTALDARKLGFEVFVIEDATRAIDLNGSLAAAWKNMTASGVKRIYSGDLV
jgi:nicotinamidase/pyrazinamidase